MNMRNRMRHGLGAGALGALLAILSSATAHAQQSTAPPDLTAKTGSGPSEIFGAKRQLAVSSDAALVFQSSSTSGVESATTTVTLVPAADYFVIQGLSVGGFVGLDYTKSGDNHTTRFSVGPRVGYNFTLTDYLSIWPKAGFSYSHTGVTSTGPNNTEVTISGDNLRLNIFVPFMVHPATHFFAGFGPFLDTDLSGDSKTTVWGAKLTLGGWVGL